MPNLFDFAGCFQCLSDTAYGIPIEPYPQDRLCHPDQLRPKHTQRCQYIQRETEGMNFPLSMTYRPEDVTHNALAGLFAGQPVLIVPDGPGEENLPAVQAARIERVTTMVDWAKAYNGG